MVINQIPSPTWNWLHMNHVTAEGFEVEKETSIDIRVPDGVGIENRVPRFWEIKSGAGEDIDAFVRDMGLSCEYIHVPAGIAVEEPLRISVSPSDGAGSADVFEIELEENAKLCVIMDFSSEKDACGNLLSLIKYRLKKGAELSVISTQNLGDKITFIDDIGGECEDEAAFHLIRLVLGGKNTYLGSRTELLGKKSKSSADLGYLLKDKESLDINYIVNHIGKKTGCDILVNGVLKDSAKKVFRGTIDFKKGAAGSVGSELEDVLLMGEDITNQTLPVILCAEEDVEGNHGATIGELDEDLMFYLMSRGNTKEDIYEMMSKARIDVIANKISDEDTKDRIAKYMKDR